MVRNIRGEVYFYYLLHVLHVHYIYQTRRRHGQRAYVFKRYCLPFLITIFYIQGAKAAQKRQRNANDKNSNLNDKSQTKTNEAAKTIVCSTCRQAFVSFVYPSRCSTTDQSFSIAAYYTCACVSDLNYLSKPTSTMPRISSLEEHAANRHSKTIADCFPTYKDPNTKLSSKV